MKKKWKREDYVFGPLHIIVRGYRANAQYGVLLWGDKTHKTLDIWVRQTLITFRRSQP